MKLPVPKHSLLRVTETETGINLAYFGSPTGANAPSMNPYTYTMFIHQVMSWHCPFWWCSFCSHNKSFVHFPPASTFGLKVKNCHKPAQCAMSCNAKQVWLWQFRKLGILLIQFKFNSITLWLNVSLMA